MLYPCKFGSTGKGNVVDLGTGTTFDVSEYAGHGSFTTDNFIVSVQSLSASGGASVGAGYANSGSTSASVTLLHSLHLLTNLHGSLITTKICARLTQV